MKIKRLFTIRVWILIALMLLAVIAIAPKFNTNGVEINFVERNSQASQNGLQVGEIIKEINKRQVNDVAEYSRLIREASFVEPKEVEVKTTKGVYIYEVLEDIGFTLDNLTIVNKGN